MYKLFLILILILIFIIIFYNIKFKKEYFEVIPSNNGIKLEISNENNINIPFNQNYNKIWKEDYVFDKSLYYQDIPINFNSNYNNYTYKKKENLIKSIINKLNKDFNNNINNFVPINYDKIKILNYNYKTWKNNNIKYQNSDLNVINKLNKSFINIFNENQKYFLNKYDLVNNGITNFKIINYKIKNIFLNKKYLKLNNKNLKEEYFKYGMIIMIDNKNSYFNHVLYYEGYYPNIFSNIKYIGKYNTSETKYYPGKDNQKLYYNLNKNILENNEDNILINDIFKVNKLRKEKIESYKIENQYACFDNNNNIIPFLNKNECESKYNWYGEKKKSGLLDKPCKKNIDCPFYQLNKNYKNNFGGCNNGKCEIPLGMKNIGYKYFNNDKPYCYNCDSKFWSPLTNIQKCCDEQYDKNKYPFLNGPDYVFKNDHLERYKHFHNNNCIMINNSIKCHK